ncbi:hypothetical protein BDN72DRAFT_905520 [Pluteus cervinus]|uniref:Uncharacterized protein n=1 Tax=Pluteus cervinus TaxID=181527 RepID=A0ACD3A324_9AGAR|nr:hypothetical protein BDN72DRAFT_905520 [Pluteus cervinus]
MSDTGDNANIEEGPPDPIQLSPHSPRHTRVRSQTITKRIQPLAERSLSRSRQPRDRPDCHVDVPSKLKKGSTAGNGKGGGSSNKRKGAPQKHKCRRSATPIHACTQGESPTTDQPTTLAVGGQLRPQPEQIVFDDVTREILNSLATIAHAIISRKYDSEMSQFINYLLHPPSTTSSSSGPHSSIQFLANKCNMLENEVTLLDLHYMTTTIQLVVQVHALCLLCI